jgi:predicted TIM-barrel fold metal-dependent hydrolase
MIIDSHCHAGKGDGLTGPWDTDAPLGAYLIRTKRAGIDRTVLFAAFSSDYRSANETVGRIVSSHPGRLSGYAMVNAWRDAGHVRRIVAEAVATWGACGIKVHRHDARITREVCETARSFGLPVLYDVMGETSTVELIATEYPSVAFIIPHLGSFADDWQAQRVMIDVLARHPNVYTDTSGVRRFDLLVEAVRRAGPRKVLFGVDGPWLHPGVELSKVLALDLPARQQQLVLAGNWLRLTAAARARTGARSAARITSGPAIAVDRPHRLEPWRDAVPPADRADPWIADQLPAATLGPPSRTRAG